MCDAATTLHYARRVATYVHVCCTAAHKTSQGDRQSVDRRHTTTLTTSLGLKLQPAQASLLCFTVHIIGILYSSEADVEGLGKFGLQRTECVQVQPAQWEGWGGGGWRGLPQPKMSTNSCRQAFCNSLMVVASDARKPIMAITAVTAAA